MKKLFVGLGLLGVIFLCIVGVSANLNETMSLNNVNVLCENCAEICQNHTECLCNHTCDCCNQYRYGINHHSNYVKECDNGECDCGCYRHGMNKREFCHRFCCCPH